MSNRGCGGLETVHKPDLETNSRQQIQSGAYTGGLSLSLSENCATMSDTQHADEQDDTNDTGPAMQSTSRSQQGHDRQRDTSEIGSVVRQNANTSYSTERAETGEEDVLEITPAVERNEDVEKEAGVKQQQPSIPPTKQYSVFSTNEKRIIIAAGSLAGFFSPLTGAIYFPALNTISQALNVSGSKINLTVTTYLVLQGAAPMVIAGFSDSMGRRPAYVLCFTIYIFANLGLGLQNSYAALLILRCIQSAGSSGTIALANGLVGDTVTSEQRGEFIAFASLGGLLGPSLSPIVSLVCLVVIWEMLTWSRLEDLSARTSIGIGSFGFYSSSLACFVCRCSCFYRKLVARSLGTGRSLLHL